MGVDRTVQGQDAEPMPDVTPDYVKDYESRLKDELAQERSRPAEALIDKIAFKPEPESPGNKGIRKQAFLTDREIRPRFLEAMKSASQDVLIISPWVNREAVNAELIAVLKDLARRRTMVLMGWGYERDEREEKKPLDPSLRDELHRITTPEKVQAVALVWLGEHHNKDVLIDRRIHLCGSHNWLSYRGDRKKIIGQSVILTVSDIPLQEQTGYIEGVFSAALRRMWEGYCASGPEPSVRAACATAWVALRQEGEALKAAKELLGREPDRVNEVIDLLRMVCLCLRGRAMGPESQSVSEFLSTMKGMMDLWGSADGGSTRAGSLAKARDILESDLGQSIQQVST
jgi:hypothetical protein